MGKNEDELQRLAGQQWDVPELPRVRIGLQTLVDAVNNFQSRRHDYWQGDAAAALDASLANFSKSVTTIQGLLEQAQDRISEANRSLADAQAAVDGLPSGDVPGVWRTAIDIAEVGSKIVFPPVGEIAVEAAFDVIRGFFGDNREAAAEKALNGLRNDVEFHAARLDATSNRIVETPIVWGVSLPPAPADDTGGGGRTPLPPYAPGGSVSYPGGGGTGGSSYTWQPDPADLRGGEVPPGTVPPEHRGPRVDSGPVTPPGSNPPGSNPPGSNPPGGNPGGNPGGGSGGNPGGLPGSNPGGSSPHGPATGLIGGGLGGGAALVGGARAAGLLGGAAGGGLGAPVGAGGLGAGGAGGVGGAAGARPGAGGLLGRAGLAEGGGTSAVATGNQSGAAAGGRGMGMMGGQGGAGEGKEKRSGLGGPIAPKLDDEDEIGPRAPGARAGGRDS